MRGVFLAAALLLPTTAVAQVAPATPIDPARHAVAEKIVTALVPHGIYARMMRDQFPPMMDAMMARMFDVNAADLGEKGGGTLRERMRQQDPHFEERTRIMNGVLGDEMATLLGTMEPRVRAGLARAFARKFTAAQLADMQTFFATPSGTAFANEYLALFADPEVVSEMASVAPQMIQAMPRIMKKVQGATAHLPPPTRKAPPHQNTGETK